MLLDFARTNVVTISPEASVKEAANLMTNHNVGSLVVSSYKKPIGIVTDRDIVTRAVHLGKDLHHTKVVDIMTGNPHILEEELSLFEALELMKDKGVRRFPIVNEDGELSGFFSIDDVLYLLAIEMSAVRRIIEAETPEAALS
ncbi:MAG: CBS domain-containing protein [Trueperaceae bacterium]|nr:CBS domain-containing protein [Trueperaceae bacterium]